MMLEQNNYVSLTVVGIHKGARITRILRMYAEYILLYFCLLDHQVDTIIHIFII